MKTNGGEGKKPLGQLAKPMRIFIEVEIFHDAATSHDRGIQCHKIERISSSERWDRLERVQNASSRRRDVPRKNLVRHACSFGKKIGRVFLRASVAI